MSAQPLSLFAQAMRDEDERFYATFPAARVARGPSAFGVPFQYDPHGDQAGYRIDRDHIACNYDYAPVATSSLNQVLVPTFQPAVPTNDPTPFYSHQHTIHDQTRDGMSPVSFAYSPESCSDVATSPMSDYQENVVYQPSQQQQQQHHHQQHPVVHQSRTPHLHHGHDIQSSRTQSYPHIAARHDNTNPHTHRTSAHDHARSSSMPSRRDRHAGQRGLSWSSHHSSPMSHARPTSMPLSPLPSKRQIEKKPPLACLFCRGRKIACGPPLPGSPDKTCNQCQRRSLNCEYPAESRRGMRKKKAPENDVIGTDHTPTLAPAMISSDNEMSP